MKSLVTIFVKIHFSIFNVYNALENACLHINQTLSVSRSYKQCTELTIHVNVNNVRTLFLYTLVQYTGKRSF